MGKKDRNVSVSFVCFYLFIYWKVISLHLHKLKRLPLLCLSKERALPFILHRDQAFQTRAQIQTA